MPGTGVTPVAVPTAGRAHFLEAAMLIDGVGPGAPSDLTPGRLRRGVVVDLVLLVATTLAVGIWCTAFTGFPKGYDVWGHLSKARMVARWFPEINWNDEWYAGEPAFQGSYPPGYHVLVAATSHVTGWSLAHSMTVLAACAVVALVGGCYLLVVAITAGRVAGLLAAGLLLGSPTMWDQVVELGLYPRFTGLGLGAVAVAGAAWHRRRATRPRALATVLVLAASLITHPVSGAVAAGAVALVLLCAHTPGPVARLRRTAAVVAAAGGLCGSFYVPLVLIPRSQSALTDVEVPLRPTELGWPTSHVLSTLPPATLVGVLVVVGTLLVARRAAVRLPAAVRNPPVATAHRPAGDVASSDVLSAYLLWCERRHQAVPELLIAGGLTLAALAAVGYGLVGHVTAHFTYYVNGLQPRDLLVYPAWLLAVALAVGGNVALRDARPVTRRAGVVVAAAAVLACLVITVPLLPGAVRDSSTGTSDAMIAILPADALHDDDHRIAGTSDATSRWINAATDTRQLRGYDDHGNLHLDRQFWLEQTLRGAAGSTRQQRGFLVDYYAARWVLTDDADATASLAADPAFTLVGRHPVLPDVAAWRYRDARPVVTAVTAPTVLVIGDDQHFDLLLRTLALADVGADRLLPVRGPATLGEVTPDLLRGHPTVLVYGATPGPHPDAAVFADYVAAGGHVVVDAADVASVDTVSQVVGAPVRTSRKSAAADRWDFTGADAGEAVTWSPPTYDGSSAWVTRAPAGGPVNGVVLLATTGSPLLVRAAAGAGDVTWSGMNLPYHALVFARSTEATYLGRLLGALDDAAPVVPLTAARPSPERREVVLPAGVDRVFVREYRADDWHATVNGRPVPVLAAGPDMMFVQVAPHATAVTVRLDYRLGAAEQAGIVVSVLTALALVWFGVGRGWPPPIGRITARAERAVTARRRRGGLPDDAR